MIIQVSVGRMQTFFELDELHPADREWTNRDGNGKGAGSISASGRFVWTSSADDDKTDSDPRTSSGQERSGNGGDKTLDGSGDNRIKAKTKTKVKRQPKAAAVAPSLAKEGRASEGEKRPGAIGSCERVIVRRWGWGRGERKQERGQSGFKLFYVYVVRRTIHILGRALSVVPGRIWSVSG